MSTQSLMGECLGATCPKVDEFIEKRTTAKFQPLTVEAAVAVAGRTIVDNCVQSVGCYGAIFSQTEETQNA